MKSNFIIRLRDKRQFLGSESPHGREMPLKIVVLKTPQSPKLRSPTEVFPPDTQPDNQAAWKNLPDGTPTAVNGKGLFFWPKDLYGNDVYWDLDTEDESGQHQQTSQARLFFASHVKIGRRFFSAQPKEARTISFPSSNIAFAPQAPLVHVPSKAALPVVSQLSLQPAEEQSIRRLSDFIGQRLLDAQGKLAGTPDQIGVQVRAIIDQGFNEATNWLEQDRNR